MESYVILFFLFLQHISAVISSPCEEVNKADNRQQPLSQYGEHLCYSQEKLRDPATLHRFIEKQLLESKSNCIDLLRAGKCKLLARRQDACRTKPEFMLYYCAVTCQTCENRTRVLSLEEGFSRRQRNNTKITLTAAGAADSMGAHQLLSIDFVNKIQFLDQQQPTPADVMKLLADARDYMLDKIHTDDEYRLVRSLCKNRNEKCALWALRGYCKHPDYKLYMSQNCGPVCFSCHELHYETLCPVNPNVKHALYPGDLHEMFHRIIHHPTFRDSVEVLSRPDLKEGDDHETVNYGLGPWMILLKDFASPEECEAIIQAGTTLGFERSAYSGDKLDAAGRLIGGVKRGRTSSTTWCDEEICESSPHVQRIIEKTEELTGLHRNYSEHLQILKYEPGEFYTLHHDYIERQRLRIAGARIVTLFLYLNNVPAGGATHFPDLNITVFPQRGAALLWPSVLDDDPHARDDRTFHQALPVVQGVKYGANAWFHQRHVRVAEAQGCY